MKPILVLISSLLFVFGCRPARDRTAESADFKRVLIETVVAADTIVVAEHSDPTDFESPSPEITYRTTNLTGRQKDQLLRLIEKSSDRPQEILSLCFVPHHSIRFFNGTTQSATLEVCLECRGMRFSRSDFRLPKSSSG